MELSIKSFDEICRACLCVSNNMKSLLTEIEGESQSLLDLFVSAANIDASTEDELPKQVCSECEIAIHKADDFRKRCLQSDDILKKVFNNLSQLDKSLTLNPEDAKNKLTFEENNDYQTDSAEIKEFGDLEDSYECDNFEEESIKKEYFEISQDEDTLDSEPIYVLPIEYEDKAKSLKTNNTIKKTKVQRKKDIETISDEYLCEYCNVTILDSKSLEDHLESHHSNLSTLKTFNDVIKTQHSDSDINKEEPKFQCSLCFRRCKTKKTLTKHMKLHERTDNVRFSCDKCKREFKYKSFLESHVISVHMHNSYNCHLCKETFKSKESLEIHIDSHTEKKHVCSVCGKAFVMLCTLKDHMRKHTGEKPYLCCTCGKGFSQKTNLAQHTRRHLGVKPFKCTLCGKSFVSKGELDAHGRKHSGAHPFVCDECGCGFTTSSALVKHRRTHTGERPYACDLCPMRFAASGTLKNHRRTHTGERPFQCSLCEKAFVQRTDLISHIRCHTGERPYVCSECGQAFRKTAALKTHLKIHGKEHTKTDIY